MKKLLFVLLSMAMLAGCTSSKKTEDQSTTVAPDTIEATEEIAEEVIEMEYSEPESAPAPKPTSAPSRSSDSNSSSSSSSYYYDEEEGEGDNWEERRKHSPNDNYLLGFDEDVGDVHDMEIYMEDY